MLHAQNLTAINKTAFFPVIMLRASKLLSSFSPALTTARRVSTQPRTLITGGLGQLGSGLAKILRQQHGRNAVVITDLKKLGTEEDAPYKYVNVLDVEQLHNTVVEHNINRVVHFAALLSAVAEKDVSKAVQVNIHGFHNIAEVCRQHGLQLFCPSTIGAFGPTTPLSLCPDITIQRPTTIYGVSKVHVELFGEYYFHKFGVDFRSLRFPGVLSADSEPGGGTTDYAVEVFHEARKTGYYKCYLRPDTRLPMMLLPDVFKATVQFMDTPEEAFQRGLRTYNIQAISFTPEELFSEMKKYYPDLKIDYEPDERQKIADSWPQVLDDTYAREDWGWTHDYDLEKTVQYMVEGTAKN